MKRAYAASGESTGGEAADALLAGLVRASTMNKSMAQVK